MSDGHTNGANENPRAVIYLLGHSALDRLAYRRLFSTELHLEVALDSDFTPTAIWMAMRNKPDLAVVDADTAHAPVLDAIQMITRLSSTIRVLLVSATNESAHVETWCYCPLHGYVTKDGGVEELRSAIEAVLAGRDYFKAEIRATLDRGRARSNGRTKLSRRESELLPLLARGLTLRAAAVELAVSYKTADSYRTSMHRKLGVHDRVELARYAIRKRIIEP
ncbi:MAG: response regulator transcription factor [Phycisphaerae bacterium]|nr:response regulator transcription factor [Phycisphaerae bacterium]